ncbi:HK97-gp10 family putative phage morphogenesis protein [Azospirillum argentinense]
MGRRSRVIGGQRLRRRLRQLPSAIRKEICEVVEEGARAILEDAVQRAPAPGAHPYATGELKSKLRYRLTKDGLTARIGSWGKRRRAAHAHLVEFGVAPHTIAMPKGGVIRHPGAPASPFLLPAFKLNRRRVGKAIAEAINRAIKRVSFI